MTRRHDTADTPSADIYAAHRRPCGHLIYPGETADDPCRWADKGCKGPKEEVQP